MERINLIAAKSLKYGGKKLQPGDVFTAPRMHAKAFVGMKKARYADAAPVAPTVPPADPSHYETADMEAEPDVDTPVAEATTQPVDDAPRVRRAYKTRVMTPKR